MHACGRKSWEREGGSHARLESGLWTLLTPKRLIEKGFNPPGTVIDKAPRAVTRLNSCVRLGRLSLLVSAPSSSAPSMHNAHYALPVKGFVIIPNA